jgi:hypothetical protein
MPFIGLMQKFLNTLDTEQNNSSLQDVLRGPLTLDKYGQIMKPFIHTKSAPDSLASEIRTKANTEAVIMIMDKAGIIKYITNKFFLSTMQISMREKFQLMETFGAASLSFFGESARVYTFAANTVDAPSQDSGISQGKYYYQSSILKMYNDVLRGSQLIADDRIAVMKTNNHLIYGYPLNIQAVYNSRKDPVTQFSLQFVVSEHHLDMPGVVTEEYLATMYSTGAHINDQAIIDFINKIDLINTKIVAVLETSVDGEQYESAGSISRIEIKKYADHNYPAPMKSEYTSLLSANVSALQSAFGSVLDGEISPLVHSKVPPETLDKLLALIPSMFDDEETFNLIGINLNNLKILQKELAIFKVYRIDQKADTALSRSIPAANSPENESGKGSDFVGRGG